MYLNINYTDTLFLIAARYGHYLIVKYLLMKGCPSNMTKIDEMKCN